MRPITAHTNPPPAFVQRFVAFVASEPGISTDNGSFGGLFALFSRSGRLPCPALFVRQALSCGSSGSWSRASAPRGSWAPGPLRLPWSWYVVAVSRRRRHPQVLMAKGLLSDGGVCIDRQHHTWTLPAHDLGLGHLPMGSSARVNLGSHPEAMRLGQDDGQRDGRRTLMAQGLAGASSSRRPSRFTPPAHECEPGFMTMEEGKIYPAKGGKTLYIKGVGVAGYPKGPWEHIRLRTSTKIFSTFPQTSFLGRGHENKIRIR